MLGSDLQTVVRGSFTLPLPQIAPITQEETAGEYANSIKT